MNLCAIVVFVAIALFSTTSIPAQDQKSKPPTPAGLQQPKPGAATGVRSAAEKYTSSAMNRKGFGKKHLVSLSLTNW
jgi:hypothetical protein